MKNGRKKINITYSKNFEKIIDFYLFKCPVDDETHLGTTFEENGWFGTKLKKYNKIIRECSNIKRDDWYIGNIGEINDLSNKYIKIKDKEFLLCNESNGKTKSIFLAIRHSFAHGDFEIYNFNKNYYYLLRNFHNNKTKALIFISEETLLNWIKIFMTNPDVYVSL